MPEGTLVISVLREGGGFVPKADTVIEPGDEVLLSSIRASRTAGHPAVHELRRLTRPTGPCQCGDPSPHLCDAIGRSGRRRDRRSDRGAGAAPGGLRRPRLRAGVGAGRGGRRHPDQSQRVARCCTGSASPSGWPRRACVRWPGTSVAGRTAGRCCAPRSATAVEAAFGFPHYQIHRADLLSVLAGALPAERVHLAHRLADLVDRGDRRRGALRQRRARDLRPAGGSRRHPFGDAQDAVRAPSSPVSRAASRIAGSCRRSGSRDLGLEVTSQVWMGPGAHFVHYFVSGGRLVNFVAIIERDTWTRESWTDRGEVADALAAFTGWHQQVRARSSGRSRRRSSGRCSIAPRWSVGRTGA